jgi:hypothetical protein
MITLEVSERQFKEKQKNFFKDDFVLTPEIVQRLEKSRQQFREGKVISCRTKEEIFNHLESL